MALPPAPHCGRGRRVLWRLVPVPAAYCRRLVQSRQPGSRLAWRVLLERQTLLASLRLVLLLLVPVRWRRALPAGLPLQCLASAPLSPAWPRRR